MRRQTTNKKKIYLVVNDSTWDSSQNLDFYAYTTLEKAKKKLAELKEKIIFNSADLDDACNEETYFSMFAKGSYATDHEDVFIREVEINE